ncbi:AcrR family transcriptional regulator [Mycolicibacterium sp. BK556]|uniref:TetR/AcrR family transcriptional regulator n=1 Tax=Mycobacteriaceae TaxID=1762 RepID=UPI00105E2E12|nr:MULTISPECIES: TetR/AcrR family transcriptional regulator C-terminal domain-containing protein [Mycobacteriaceae]MBB3603242.1 AcrR family transcriptional regulator [Mycolicibacterium sp. BK556]MBB3633437.1 AcrR family transcriptional regulator [Mycolicibacterium sp. BK607]MBB3751010.1 AcrR family transcriptional regulator [Mycolicibacterium sp. BK634]TDO07409.1 tetracycline repressor-like protein [Mycobacterium sp. BK086]
MRPRFTIDEIQTAALQIVDRDGLAGLSMRTLAAALGTGAMTLYNYVRDRDQLEELVAEAVIAGVELPEASADWLADVRAIATAMWQSVRAHPNAIPLVLTRRTVSPTSYAAAEGLVGALSRGGLDGAALLGAFRAVLSLVMGSAQVELAGPLAGAGREEQQRQVAAQIGVLAADRHHRLAALAEVSRQSSATADFECALDLLLTGIQASAQTLSTSPGPDPAVG